MLVREQYMNELNQFKKNSCKGEMFRKTYVRMIKVKPVRTL